ncbi:histidine phosphatase family protein [Caldalkalibacillus salinus]|uniref:histidine phosphatase family protein n=1 Tax=Caldalkalibacillus salinus TaxID=2803787 RepID=UPI00192290D2|nr:histidine phosphatase family protein [Caldalkalibacillus salinus]
MGLTTQLDLYLVRHGLTEWNKQKRYLGHTDIDISATHINEISMLKDALHPLSFDVCYTSDLRRCVQTVQHLLPYQSYHVDQRLRELNFGLWEGLTYEQLKENQHYQSWLSDWEAYSPPQGETGHQFLSRVQSFLSDCLTDHIPQAPNDLSRVLVVTHGGVIRAILSAMVKEKSFWEWQVQHGSAIRLRLGLEEGEWQCYSWSAVPTQASARL